MMLKVFNMRGPLFGNGSACRIDDTTGLSERLSWDGRSLPLPIDVTNVDPIFWHNNLGINLRVF